MSNKANEHGKKLIEIRPYNVKELAVIYGVSRRVLSGWLKVHESAIGQKHGQYYTALQVKIIFERLGLPSHIEDND